MCGDQRRGCCKVWVFLLSQSWCKTVSCGWFLQTQSRLACSSFIARTCLYALCSYKHHKQHSLLTKTLVFGLQNPEPPVKTSCESSHPSSVVVQGIGTETACEVPRPMMLFLMFSPSGASVCECALMRVCKYPDPVDTYTSASQLQAEATGTG